MPRVTRTPQAINDIADILAGLSRLSKPASVRVRAAFDRTTKLLARSPGLGRARPDQRPDLFSYTFAGKYVIYYRIISNGIEIARVLHGSRDVDPSMFDD